ncbi:MAG: hypothetical protein SF066_10400 [Thermoanaerobaculia bacterium]|nr:hypothetical protein [Thermoanaerobaculia bacterium]
MGVVPGFRAGAQSSEFYLSIDHLATPAAYDNLGAGLTAGQTFLAQAASIAGIRVLIGVNGQEDRLVGPADLVLYDASNLDLPVELARTTFLAPGVEISGLVDLFLESPVPATLGQRYFIAVFAPDLFGMGIRSISSSTYPGGAEGFLVGGQVAEAISGRDVSFAVHSVNVVFEDGFESGELAAWSSHQP